MAKKIGIVASHASDVGASVILHGGCEKLVKAEDLALIENRNGSKILAICRRGEGINENVVAASFTPGVAAAKVKVMPSTSKEFYRFRLSVIGEYTKDESGEAILDQNRSIIMPLSEVSIFEDGDNPMDMLSNSSLTLGYYKGHRLWEVPINEEFIPYHLLLVGSTGCLVGDERIILGNGGVEYIQNLGEEHLQPLRRLIRTGKSAKDCAFATTFFKYPPQPILEIVTESGRSLKGTYNHPILVQTPHQLPECDVWKRLDELRVGDKVLVVRSIGTNNSKVWAYKSSGWTTPKIYHKSFAVQLPGKVDEKLASLFGLLVADGNIHYHNNIPREVNFYIADDEEDLIHQIQGMVKTLFGCPISIHHHKQKRLFLVSIHRTAVAKAFASIDGLKEKRIPGVIWQSKDTVMAAFLRWLFEGDGSVDAYFSKSRNRNGYRIILTSTNIELLRDVQLALLRWGIHSRINVTRLIIGRGEAVQLFAERIGFPGATKSKKLGDNLKTIEGLSWQQRRTSCPYYERVVRVVKHPPEPVYDIEVPEGHRFIANGFISHNSGKSLLARFQLIPLLERAGYNILVFDWKGSDYAPFFEHVIHMKDLALEPEVVVSYLTAKANYFGMYGEKAERNEILEALEPVILDGKWRKMPKSEIEEWEKNANGDMETHPVSRFIVDEVEKGLKGEEKKDAYWPKVWFGKFKRGWKRIKLQDIQNISGTMTAEELLSFIREKEKVVIDLGEGGSEQKLAMFLNFAGHLRGQMEMKQYLKLAVILDEGPQYTPWSPEGIQRQTTAIIRDLCALGRTYGLSMTLLSQGIAGDIGINAAVRRNLNTQLISRLQPLDLKEASILLGEEVDEKFLGALPVGNFYLTGKMNPSPTPLLIYFDIPDDLRHKKAHTRKSNPIKST